MTPPRSRAVLVTGASRGIGRAVAQAFASQGDRVAVHYRDSAALARDVLAGLPGGGLVDHLPDRLGVGQVRADDRVAGAGQPGQHLLGQPG